MSHSLKITQPLAGASRIEELLVLRVAHPVRGSRPRLPRLDCSSWFESYIATMVVRKRLNFDGSGLFFVTTTVGSWLPVFRDPALADLVLRRLSESTIAFAASVVAYVLMPSHLHALIGLEETRALSQFMRSLKSLSAKDVKSRLSSEAVDKLTKRGVFALWQPRFDDLLIVSEKQFKTKVDYIHTNPVRAGLAAEPTDYPYSSARDWLLEEPGPVAIVKSFKWMK